MMIKILLFLTVFTSASGWQRLTDDPPQQFSSVADCVTAAAAFLERSSHAISKEVPAVGAQCVMGNDDF